MFSFIKKLLGGADQEKTLNMLNQQAIILDVRTASEFSQGHVASSINIPLDQLQGQISRLKKKNKPVVACCATGRRSGIATGMLRRAGLDAVNGGGWHAVQRLLNQSAALVKSN